MDNKQEKEEKMKKPHIIGHIPKLFTAVICWHQRGLYTYEQRLISAYPAPTICPYEQPIL
uniref:hypothetical protein n=1 Tax=Prevotella fusca TaxID=589436 RepID=UPI003F9FD3FA